MNPTLHTTAVSLNDLGRLVTVQYPDRPDLALIAALRLLSMPGGSAGITVAYANGALLTRRARMSLRTPSVPTNVNEARRISDETRGGLLLIGTPELAVVICGGGGLLDISSTYRLADLDLPHRLLCGPAGRSPHSPQHTLVDYPFGLTGVYAIKRIDSPLSVASRLVAALGPLNRRRLDHDLAQLESLWRQLRQSA